MRLDKKVALITGAASGIGREIANSFFREGAQVAIADLNAEAASQAAREIDPRGERAIGGGAPCRAAIALSDQSSWRRFEGHR